MKGLRLGLSLTGGAAALPSFNFSTGTYSIGGTSYGSLASVPGYTYTRTGALAAPDSDNSIDSFAADTPPINGYGYHAYGALTNSLLQSQTFDNASWTKNAISVTANAATAPDGTATADKLIPDATFANHSIEQSVTKTTAAEDWIGAFYVKAAGYNYAHVRLDDGGGNAVQQYVNLTDGATALGGGGGSFVLNSITATSVGNGWYRVVLLITTAVSANLRMLVYASSGTSTAITGDGTSGIYLWQAALEKGDFSEGGPILVTTTAAASIGAPTLSVDCPNGSYTATYTFDDDTTQDIPTTISSGAFTMPAYPTLNRPRVKSVVLI